LKNILCGAAPLSKELQNEVSERLHLKVVQTWGMTEVTCSSLHVPGGRDDRSGSVGYIDPNCSMKLIDDVGKEVGPNQRGEIHVKGPNICMGYWRNERATQETFDDEGFLKTELEALLLEHEHVADAAVCALQLYVVLSWACHWC
jgi:4-coumarate--CoA ligase